MAEEIQREWEALYRKLEFNPEIPEGYAGKVTVNMNAKDLVQFIEESTPEEMIPRYVHTKWIAKIVEEAFKKIDGVKLVDSYLTLSEGATSSTSIVDGVRVQLVEKKAWIYPEEILKLEDEIDELDCQIKLKKEVLKKKKEVAKVDGSATTGEDKEGNEIKDQSITVVFL